MEYYRVLYSNDYAKKNGKFGIVKTFVDVDEYLLDDGMEFPNILFNDIKFVFEGNGKKEFADFQMMYYSWKLISEKMQRILLPFSSPDMVYFHPVMVLGESVEIKKYYILHFLKKLDVLDKNRTGNGLLNPFINKDLLQGVDFFVYKEFDPGVFCISGRVKEVMEKEMITGCVYQRIS